VTDTELELPQGWTISSINQVCKTSSGGTPSRGKPEYYGGSIHWIKSGELKESMIYDSDEKITKMGLENSSAKIFSKGTVLLALYGANIGNTGLLQIDSATNQAVCAIFNDKDLLDTNYLLWYIRFMKKNLVKQAIGGAQPNISQTIVNKLKILLPPLNEQKRIVSKIEELFSKIDSVKQSLEHTKLQLEQYRISLLKYAFEGKLTERWEVVKFKELTKSRKIGLVRSKREQSESGTPYLKMNNITIDGKLDLSSIVYVNCSDQELQNYLLEKNDILFNTRNSFELVGKTTIWNNLIKNCIFNNNIMRIRTNNTILPKFLCYFMNSNMFKTKLLSVKKATTNICAIYDKDLKEQLISFPIDIKQQKEIILKIEQGFALIENTSQIVESSLQNLQTMKMSVLKQAFEGKLVPQDPNDEPASVLLERIKLKK